MQLRNIALILAFLALKKNINSNVFSLRNITYEETLNEINSLDFSKSTQSEDISFKIIKDNADIFANFILQNFNKYIIDGKFPDQLKKQTLFLPLKNRKCLINISVRFCKKNSTRHALIAIMRKGQKNP